jgi:hypothetical protein
MEGRVANREGLQQHGKRLRGLRLLLGRCRLGRGRQRGQLDVAVGRTHQRERGLLEHQLGDLDLAAHEAQPLEVHEPAAERKQVRRPAGRRQRRNAQPLERDVAAQQREVHVGEAGREAEALGADRNGALDRVRQRHPKRDDEHAEHGARQREAAAPAMGSRRFGARRGALPHLFRFRGHS